MERKLLSNKSQEDTTMNKKAYMKPAQRVVMMNGGSRLMAGSLGDPTPPGIGGGGGAPLFELDDEELTFVN